MVSLGNKIDTIDIYDGGVYRISVSATTGHACCTFCSDPELIFLTDGASKGVMQILNTIIRDEKDGV